MRFTIFIFALTALLLTLSINHAPEAEAAATGLYPPTGLTAWRSVPSPDEALFFIGGAGFSFGEKTWWQVWTTAGGVIYAENIPLETGDEIMIFTDLDGDWDPDVAEIQQVEMDGTEMVGMTVVKSYQRVGY